MHVKEGCCAVARALTELYDNGGWCNSSSCKGMAAWHDEHREKEGFGCSFCCCFAVRDNDDMAKPAKRGRLRRQAAGTAHTVQCNVMFAAAESAQRSILAAACTVAQHICTAIALPAGPSGASSHRASPGAAAAAAVVTGTAAKARNRCSHTAAAPHDDR